MPRLPRAPIGSPVVIDPAVWNYLCDCVERSLNITVSAPLHASVSPSGTAISLEMPGQERAVLVTQSGGAAGTNQSSACTFTYDIYDAIKDPNKVNKLNATGGALSLTGKGNGWRGLKIVLTAGTRGRAYQKPDGAWLLTMVDESPAAEQDCT
jgi:hypothetical protein